METTRGDMPIAATLVNAALPTGIGLGVNVITGNPVAGKIAGTAGRVLCTIAPNETAMATAAIGIGAVLLPACFLMGPVIALGLAVAVPLQLAYELTRNEQ